MNGLRQAQRLIIAVTVLATLGACGKRAALEPPDDTTVSYTYPQQYPNPVSVLPPKTEEPSKTRERLPPPTAGSLSPFPTDRTTTTTYQSGPLPEAPQ